MVSGSPEAEEMKSIEINLAETFSRLAKAPVAEAALEMRTRADDAWLEETMTAELRRQLTDYPAQKPRKAFAGAFQFRSDGESTQSVKDLGWCGIVATDEDGKQIACFERDRFLFSRLEPYSCWDDFLAEAHRLWELHCHLAHPAELQRIGLRFINRMRISGERLQLEDYLTIAPKEPDGLPLPFLGFLHRDVLAVPGHDYGVMITRTIQPETAPNETSAVLIVDIDVFTTQPIRLEDANLERRLLEMRWLKNKAFFGSVTPKMKELLQ